MLSTRNIDSSKDYQLISTYAGASKRETKKTRSKSIDEATTQTVRKIPGGEYLMNVKVYLITRRLRIIRRRTFYAIEGDVWGQPKESQYRGFQPGDNVLWKVAGKFKSGTVKTIIDNTSCIVIDENGTLIEKKFDKITKSK